MTEPSLPATAPQAHEFAEQLIEQLLADLDGLLFEDRRPVIAAGTLLRDAAAAGAARGALWLLLVHAALNAHGRLVFGDDETPPAVTSPSAIEAALLQLLPRAQAQLAALRAHAERLRHYVALAERAREPSEVAIERAIVRLYQGLGSGDETLGGRGLIELRSLAVYLDATASAIDLQANAAEPVQVIRPDRFHDYFLRFNESAQTPATAAGERAVAALSREGRISALVTRDEHPLEVAERELRAHIGDDVDLQDHSLLRIKALLAFIEQLRRDPAGNTLLGNPLDDLTAHSSLVVAAATAPLLIGGEFNFAVMAQLARFNLTLLRQQTLRSQLH
ncbi:MAG: hypothetical protein JWR16_353 [Nevskia sp.]|nr:hypothetical protein [Nevskia sp.]